jgi:GT2 family glycosyltransferase
MNAPEISFAIPTLFGGPMLLECLVSIAAEIDRTGVRAEVVIVADGTDDVGLLGVSSALSGVRVIRHVKARGVGPSVNESILASTAPFVSLLNDDMTVEPGYISAMLAAIDRDRVFAVNPRAEWHETGDVYNGRCALSRANGYPEIVYHLRDEDGPCFFASGGGVFRRRTFEELGGFDPIFHPFYWEDADCSYRAWCLGYEVTFSTKARIRHKSAVTVRKVSSEAMIEATAERNRWLFAWSSLTSPEWMSVLMRGPLAARNVPVPAALEGYARAHLRLRDAMKRRSRMIESRVINDEAILEKITP